MSDTPETDEELAYRGFGVFTMSGLPATAVNVSFARELERERDGWRKAAYSLGEALPASWEELQPPAEQLRKFKEMVAFQNKKTKELLNNADKHSKMYP